MKKRTGNSLHILQRIRKASADAPCPCGSGIRVRLCDHRRFLRRRALDQGEVGGLAALAASLSLPAPKAPRRQRRAAAR